jgi:rhomboid protease GluP
MHAAVIKIKLIFIPFFLVALALIVGYTFLNWLLVIKLAWVHIDENIINTLLPLLLTWVPLYFFLRARFQLYDVNIRKGHDLLFLALAGFFTIVPMVLAQSYIQTATGKRTDLPQIANMANVPPTKYYTIKKYGINKTHARTSRSTTMSGSQGEHLTTTIFIACPILADSNDTPVVACKYWFGIKYSDRLDNPNDTTVINDFWNAFWLKSMEHFKTTAIPPFYYLERLGKGKNYKGFTMAIQQAMTTQPPSFSEKSKETVVLVPIDTPFEQRNGNALAWIVGWLIIGAIVMMAVIMMKPLNTERLAQLLNKHTL